MCRAVTSLQPTNHTYKKMNATEHNLRVEAPKAVIPIQTPMPTQVAMPETPKLGALASLGLHWPEYLMEAACSVLSWCRPACSERCMNFPGSPVHQAIMSGFLRRLFMGVSMGFTAIAIIYSPWGKQSGAHINPSVTLTFFRLGKIKVRDALFYIAAQFIGAVLGVFLVDFFWRKLLGPGRALCRHHSRTPGTVGGLVRRIHHRRRNDVGRLYFSNHHRLAGYTGLFAGLLVATYITLEAPFSGMSMNPARTFGSALPPMIWDGLWVYLTAPPLGMLFAAELYLWRKGQQAVMCCKLHHNNDKRCIFCGANGGFAS